MVFRGGLVFGATCPEEIRTLNSIACLAKKIKFFFKNFEKVLNFIRL